MLITEGHELHSIIKSIPGEWYDGGDRTLIRVHRNGPRGRKWVATIYDSAKWRKGTAGQPQVQCGRTVFGTYPTAEAAVAAAQDRLLIDECPERVSNWKDVIEARKEMKKKGVISQ